ncbi:MAG: hypothetical protein ACR2QV_17165 [Gammaproteobacteria bacterium]
MSILLLSVGMAALAQDGAQDSGWDESWDDDWEEEQSGWLPLTGFLEVAGGTRWDRDDQVGRRGTLLDLRWRLESGWENDAISVTLKGDLLADGIDDELTVDVRDASLAFSPVASLDVKAGRQVLTWGTGDLLFLNDLFPKDWVSFFAGRDDEYLKAPSNSLRLTQYNAVANIDFVWTPEFTPDNYIDGDRFSYFSPFDGMKIGAEPPVLVDEPSNKLSNSEYALRLFKTHGGVEYALYGYSGFFKTPSRVTGPRRLSFAPMTSIGVSLRRSLGPGLFNLEGSYYISRDDGSGTDPLVANSQVRLLAGYEWEARRNFNVGLQYYVEHIVDYDNLIANSPAPQFEPPENRHQITTRLTYRAMQDKLTWSFFAFVSPNEQDYYLRPIVAFRADDNWTYTVGLNLFGGDEAHTFLGQFEDNSNAYLRVRYNY